MKKVNVCDYKEFGQRAIQAAVDECAREGGGQVWIPGGEWESGPIHLRSNIHLILDEKAVVRFSDRFSDYLPMVFTRWGGMECWNYSPLIYARDCENISITGKGTFHGNGQAWWHWKMLQQEAANQLCYAQADGIPVEQRRFGTEKAALRPSFLQTISCKNVKLEGFTMIDGPQWTIHPVYCDHVVVRGVTVLTHGHNTDGLNPDSCKNVWIEDCTFDTGDDCIAINSGMNEDGWRVNRPCENIVIRNCTMNGGHGGLVIGSGMSAGVRNVTASGCKIKNTFWGIRIKSMRGRGGYVENVSFQDITLSDMSREMIQINMFYDTSTVVPRSKRPPAFRNICLEGIEGEGKGLGLELRGLPEQAMQDIRLSHVHLKCGKSMVCEEVQGLSMEDVVFQKIEELPVSLFSH